MTFLRRGNKFRAVRTNGFASKLEASVHGQLLFKEIQGEIKNIKCQQTVVLVPGPPKVRIAWKLDFSCEDAKTGAIQYHEAKGVKTRDFMLKLKLWRANPPADLFIWQGNYRRPFIAETILKEKSA